MRLKHSPSPMQHHIILKKTFEAEDETTIVSITIEKIKKPNSILVDNGDLTKTMNEAMGLLEGVFLPRNEVLIQIPNHIELPATQFSAKPLTNFLSLAANPDNLLTRNTFDKMNIFNYDLFTPAFLSHISYVNLRCAIQETPDSDLRKRMYAHIGSNMIIGSIPECSSIMVEVKNRIYFRNVGSILDPMVERYPILKTYIQNAMDTETIEKIIGRTDTEILEFYIRQYDLMTTSFNIRVFELILENCGGNGIEDLISNAKVFISDPLLVTSEEKCKFVKALNKNSHLTNSEKLEFIGRLF